MLKRIVSLFCAAIMLILPFNVAYADGDGKGSTQVLNTGEIPSLRTPNSKTYIGDKVGEYKCVVSSENIHYMNSNGEYVDISNKLVSNSKTLNGTQYRYSNEANNYAVRFAGQGNSYPMILEYQDVSLAMGLVNSSEKSFAINLAQKNKMLSELIVPEYAAVYTEVYPGVDLMYQAMSSGVKEYLVLKQPTEQNEFLFSIKCKGLKAINTSGGVLFIDGKGTTIFSIGQLFAIDSKEAYTGNVTCEVIEKNGESYLKLVLDKQFLLDKDRQFPVIIDPTTMVTGGADTQDTYVCERYDTTNYYLNTYLRTGRDDEYYTRRTYINFTLPTSIPSSGVTAVWLNLKKYSGTTPSIRAFRVLSSWSSSTIQWRNKADYTSTEGSAVAINYNTDWWRMDVTTIVQKMLSGTYAKYGFVVRDLNESDNNQWTTFYSSDAPSPNKPELIINYVNTYGSRPYQYLSSLINVNCMGYALEYNQYIDRQAIGLQDSELLNKTTSELLSVVYNKSKTWMNNYIGSNYRELSSFDSNISTTSFRVVLRVGFDDLNQNGRYDSGETFDYHWWYQTSSSNGLWADKLASNSSQLRYESKGIDPVSLPWTGTVNYTSAGKFFEIYDVRNNGW